MNRHLYLIATLFLSSFLLTSCEFSVSTANIKEAKLTKDEAGQTPTTVFGPQDVIYLKVILANASDSTVTTARWIAADVNIEGIEKNHELDSVDLEQGSGELTFDLSNNQAWPTGQYRVELLLNGEMNQSFDFTVE